MAFARSSSFIKLVESDAESDDEINVIYEKIAPIPIVVIDDDEEVPYDVKPEPDCDFKPEVDKADRSMDEQAQSVSRLARSVSRLALSPAPRGIPVVIGSGSHWSPKSDSRGRSRSPQPRRRRERSPHPEFDFSPSRSRSRSPLPFLSYSVHNGGRRGDKFTRGWRAEWSPRGQSVISSPRSSRYDRSTLRAPLRDRSPMSSFCGNFAAAATIGTGVGQVLNSTQMPKKEDDGDSDIEILGETLGSSPPSLNFNNQNDAPFDNVEAYAKKRLGTRDDPIRWDYHNPSRSLKHEPCTITMISEDERARFRIVMLDPTYGTYPLEAINVTKVQTVNVMRAQGRIHNYTTYEFQFTPVMYGPHLVVVTSDDFFITHAVRVQSPNPPRNYNQNRRRLPRLEVNGIPREMGSLFHAPRPRRDNEKFVDVQRVIESLIG